MLTSHLTVKSTKTGGASAPLPPPRIAYTHGFSNDSKCCSKLRRLRSASVHYPYSRRLLNYYTITHTVEVMIMVFVHVCSLSGKEQKYMNNGNGNVS